MPPASGPRRDGDSGPIRQLRASASEQQDLGQRDGFRVGDGHEGLPATDGVESPARDAVQDETRRPAMAHDLDVAPQDVLCVTRAQRLHGGFLGREATREVDGRTMSTLAVGDLAGGEHASREAIAPPFDNLFHAIDVSRIETEADDIGHDASMILPLPAPAFAWRDGGGQPSLVCRPLEAHARHLFTSSLWSLGSRGERDRADAWAPVAAAIDVAPGLLARLRQVHGVTVVTSSRALQPPPEGDILIVREPGAGGAVQVADCVPVLIADRRTGAVAAVHAGWRGLAARAPQVAVEALVRACGVNVADLVVALGPSVGACCYEVGPDVRERFAASGFDRSLLTRWFRNRPAEMVDNPPIPAVLGRQPRPDRWFFDGWAAVRHQLTAAGVPDECIHSAGLCTASHPQIFCSYRRDGAPSGRLAAAIRCESPRP